jgi:hypothetical protein
MFTVESVDDTVARLRPNGGELVGEVAQYKDMYRLCYMRGPAGIIVALAEELERPKGRLARLGPKGRPRHQAYQPSHLCEI